MSSFDGRNGGNNAATGSCDGHETLTDDLLSSNVEVQQLSAPCCFDHSNNDNKPDSCQVVLYGREGEMDMIRQAYHQVECGQVSKAFVIVTGEEGVGKTELVRQTFLQLQQQQRQQSPLSSLFLLRGKCDAFHEAADPFRSVYDAILQSVCHQVHKGVEEALTKVHETERQSLSSVVQRLDTPQQQQQQQQEWDSQKANNIATSSNNIASSEATQPLVHTSSSSSSFEALADGNHDDGVVDDNDDDDDCPNVIGSLTMKRFASLMPKILRALATVTPYFPTVVVVDDLHWAAAESLDLYRYIMSETSAPTVFVATAREITPSIASWMNQLQPNNNSNDDDDDKKNTMRVSSIHIQNLPQEPTEAYVLSSGLQTVDRYFEASRGNPAILTELVRLARSNNLTPPPTNHVFGSIRELWCRSLSKIADAFLLEILMVVSCFGFAVEAELLSASQTATITEKVQRQLEKVGLVTWEYEGVKSFVFTNNGLQEALYALASRQDVSLRHLRIGRRLLRRLLQQSLSPKHSPFIVFHLNRGLEAMTDPQERTDLANIALEQAKLAAKKSNFKVAAAWLDLGHDLMGGRWCWRDEYHLVLALHNATAEVSYAGGMHSRVQSSTETIVKNARCFQDTVLARCMQAYSLGALGKSKEAVSCGLDVLCHLKERLPERRRGVGNRHKRVQLWQTRRLLRGKTLSSLRRLPTMTDPQILAKMQLYAVTACNAFVSEPQWTSILTMRMVQLSVKHGLCSISALGFTLYGKMLTSVGGNVDEGYEFAKLGLDTLHRFRSKEWVPRVYLIFYAGLNGWKQPFENNLVPLKYAYRVGLQTGDIEGAMFIGNAYTYTLLVIGKPLSSIKTEMSGLLEEMKVHGQDRSVVIQRVFVEAIAILSEGTKDDRYDRFMHDEGILGGGGVDTRDALFWMKFLRLVLSLIFQDVPASIRASASCDAHAAVGGVHALRMLYLRSLAALSCCRGQLPDGSSSRRRRRTVLRGVRRRLKELRRHAPSALHFLLGKLYLLEAEMAAWRGDPRRASMLYMSAVSVSARQGDLLDEALATERAANFYLGRGEMQQAQNYLGDAIKLYERWGAIPKVTMLKDQVQTLQSLVIREETS